MRRLIPRPTYANVVASIALFVALGGTSYAVIQIPRNSVGTAQLKSNSVTSAKIRDQSVTARDIASTAFRGPRGAQGPPGPTGPVGQPGPVGVSQMIVRRRAGPANVGLAAGSGVNVATLSLPPGTWFVQAVTNAISFSPTADIFRCTLLLDGAPQPGQHAIMIGGSAGVGAILAPSTTVQSAAASTILLSCSHDGSLAAHSESPRFERTMLSASAADRIDLRDVTG